MSKNHVGVCAHTHVDLNFYPLLTFLLYSWSFLNQCSALYILGQLGLCYMSRREFSRVCLSFDLAFGLLLGGIVYFSVGKFISLCFYGS